MFSRSKCFGLRGGERVTAAAASASPRRRRVLLQLQAGWLAGTCQLFPTKSPVVPMAAGAFALVPRCQLERVRHSALCCLLAGCLLDRGGGERVACTLYTGDTPPANRHEPPLASSLGACACWHLYFVHRVLAPSLCTLLLASLRDRGGDGRAVRSPCMLALVLF